MTWMKMTEVIDADGVEWVEVTPPQLDELLNETEADKIMDIRFPSLRTGRLLLKAAALEDADARDYAREMIEQDIHDRKVAQLPTTAELDEDACKEMDEINDTKRLWNLIQLRTDMMSMPCWHRHTAAQIARREIRAIDG